MKPENWSEEFTYSPMSVYIGFVKHTLYSTLPEDLQKHSACIEEKRAHPHIKIEFLGVNHPLAGQRGVFATHKILQQTELGEYVGEVFLGSGEAELFPKKDVHAWLAEYNQLGIKTSSHRFANELAFINDYRGIQNLPNATFQWIVHEGFYYFGYATTRDIEPGEEILVDYGQSWEKALADKYVKI